MLVEAAAKEWEIPVKDIKVKDGIISHGNKTATFGELAGKAAALPVPQSPTLNHSTQRQPGKN